MTNQKITSLSKLSDLYCANDDYSGFIYSFEETIKFTTPVKRIRAKAKSRPCFKNEFISAMQRQNNFYKKFKSSKVTTDKDNIKPL